jgi:hypothetical protein
MASDSHVAAMFMSIALSSGEPAQHPTGSGGVAPHILERAIPGSATAEESPQMSEYRLLR